MNTVASTRTSVMRPLCALGATLAISLTTSPLRASEPAPSPLWFATSRSLASNSQAGASGLALDSAGNAYVTGFVQGSEVFGKNTVLAGPPGGGIYVNFLAKYDPQGSLLWTQSVTGEVANGMTVAVKPPGNTPAPSLRKSAPAAPVPAVYVAASTSDTNLAFGSTTVSATLDLAYPSATVVLAAYDSAGDLLWARQAATGSGDFSGTGPAIKVDTSGNVYLAGFFTAEATFGTGATAVTNLPEPEQYHLCLAKYDPSGNLLWVQSATATLPSFDSPPALALDDFGNVYFADGPIEAFYSWQLSTPASNPPPASPSLVTTIYNGPIYNVLAKFGPSGDPQWSQLFTSDYGVGIGGLAADHAGNAYLGGTFQIEASFGSVSITNPSAALTFYSYSPDSFLAKYGPDGSLQWVQPIIGSSGESVTGVALDKSGNPAVIGYLGYFQNIGFYGDSFFGDDEVLFHSSPSPFIAKFTPSGAIDWVYQDGGATFGLGWALAFDQYNQATFAAYGGNSTGYQSIVGKLAATESVSPPRIAEEPVSEQLVMSGDNATLHVDALGARPLMYQWYFQNKRLPGATSATLEVHEVHNAQAGTYRVEVRNRFGSVTSSNSTLVLGPSTTLPAFLRASSGGGLGPDTGSAIAADADGNFYTAGFYSQNARFGTNVFSPADTTDSFIAKYNSHGNLLWVRPGGSSLPTTAYALALDAGGNPVVTGGPLLISSFQPGQTTGFTSKYDHDGNLLWTLPVGGYGLAFDHAGDFWLFNQPMGFPFFSPPGFLNKYDSSGNLIVSNIVDGASLGTGHPLAVDSVNNVYLVESGFDSSLGLSGGVLSKYSPAGQLLWSNFVTNTQSPSIAIDRFDRLYLSGANLGSQGLTGQPVIARLDTNGATLWRHEYQTSAYGAGNDVAVDDHGNIWWCGNFFSNINFGSVALNSLGSNLFISAYDSRYPDDAFLAELDPSGNLKGVREIACSEGLVTDLNPTPSIQAPYRIPGTVLPFAMTVNPAGHVLLTGEFGNTQDIPGVTANFSPYQITSRGDLDYFVAELALPVTHVPPPCHPIRHRPFEDKRDFGPHLW